MVMLREFKMFVNNEWTCAEGDQRLESVDPSTGDAWATFPNASAVDVDRAVSSAHEAMYRGPWSRATPTERGNALYRIGDALANRASELAVIETRDTGKLIRETESQIKYVAQFFRYFAGLADKIDGAVFPIDKPEYLSFSMWEPIGAVAAVVPWNSSLFLMAVKVAPALAAGNSVVIKPSEYAPATLLEFGKILVEAGIPPGVVNIVTGVADPCGRALTSHPLIAHIAFTGGEIAARHVVTNSASNFSTVSLELGGKSPIIIFRDADIDNALNCVVAGIFGAAGQSCGAGSRLYIEQGIEESFLELIINRARKIVIGDPQNRSTEMGPLATLAQIERSQRLIAESVKQGAEVLLGGGRPDAHPRGWYFEPTILSCPSNSIVSVQDEFFAPVLSVLTFSGEDEALKLANDNRYGLVAGVFTENGGRALRLSRQIRSGTVFINTYRATSPMVPFGGFGASGYGREAGRDSILDYCKTKSVWYKTTTDAMSDPFIMR